MRPRGRATLTPRRERGAVIVLAGVMLTSLMIFAALAVDIANGQQSRRQAQSAADAAALAAAQNLPNKQAAAATAKSYAYRNYGIPTSSWSSCVDSGHLSLVSPDGTECISFNTEVTIVRVKLPTTDVATAFGGVIGAKTLSVSAVAEAEGIITESNRIIPAAVTAGMGTGLLCIEKSGNNTACSGQTTGNFGDLDSPRLLIYKAGANVNQTELALNYALSLDHDIFRYVSGSKVCDGETNSPCTADNVTSGLSANHINVLTGNNTTTVTQGFVQGGVANTTDLGNVTFCGRLQRPDLTSANVSQAAPGNCQTPGTPTIDVLQGNDQRTINGRHVYYHMVDWARQTFYSEVWNYENNNGMSGARGMLPNTNALYAAGDVRLNCFLDGFVRGSDIYHDTLPTCTGVTLPTPMPAKGYRAMFSMTIEADPRFGLIPVALEWVTGQSKAMQVVGFLGLYIYALNTTNTQVQAVGAWVYDTAMIDDPDGNFGFKSDPVVRLVR